MPTIVHIDVEPATHESFAPFGQLIGPSDDKPVFHGDGLRSWRLKYEIDGTTEVMFIQFDFKPMVFSKIERHFNVTQSFLPLDAAEMIMVVGPRTNPDDWTALPAPQSLRAFLVPGTHGVMMWKGVWHALNRFPTKPPGAGFALLTAAETQNELERQLQSGYQPKLTQAADYLERFDVTFEVVTSAQAKQPTGFGKKAKA